MEWVSVKDELPEEGEKVLTIDFSKPEFLEYRIDYTIKLEDIKEHYLWACRFADEYNKVTHWMPLPVPPNKND